MKRVIARLLVCVQTADEWPEAAAGLSAIAGLITETHSSYCAGDLGTL